MINLCPLYKELVMKKLIQSILLSAITTCSFSQLTSTIKGTIIDKASQTPLIGVNIVLNTNDPIKGTITDFNGEFRLENVPVGRQSIQISYVGYKTQQLDNVLVKSAKETELNISMIEDLSQLKEIVIKGDDKRENINKMNTVSSRTISIEEATRFSGSFQDPARMAQNYAGVSGNSDDRNDIIIRGNSPLGVLWRMEGIDIPSPNHFSTIGTTGGPISMLNINNLKNSEFLTSAWSSEYGNALSGVFDLQLRNGNNSTREHMFQVGFNGFELGTEGPFKKGKRATYMINYRYSTLGALHAIGLNLGTGDAIPEYQDITFKMDFPTKKAGVFSFWGVGGMSFIHFEPDSTADSTNLFADATQESLFESKTGIIGATHKYFFNNNTFSKIVFTANTAITSGQIDSVDIYSGYRVKDRLFDRTLTRYSFHAKINQKINAKNNWNAGIIGNLFDINFVDSLKFLGQFVQQTKFVGNTTLFQGYAQWKHLFNELVSANIGIHSQHFVLANKTVIEPRIGITYQINEKNKFTFGAGQHSQIQPINIYFRDDFENQGSTILPNKNLDFSKAIHTVLGHEVFLDDNTRLKTEIYYQHLYNIPIEKDSSTFSMINEGADFALPNNTNLTNSGLGKNYGLEVTFERFLSKGFYFLFTTSLFESKYTASDGIERNSAFNTNYVINFLAGKEFLLNEKFTLTFDGNITTSGGRRYTPIDLTLSQLYGVEIRDYSKAFSEQYRSYFRLDFKVGFRLNTKSTTHEFSVDIQNITNQKNIFIQGFKASTGSIATTYQRGFFPIVLYKLYF